MLKPLLWILCITAVYGLAVLFRFHHVHSESGEWRDRPSAAPPIVHYHGRVYDRSSTKTALRASFTMQGTDAGGGLIYAPTNPNPRTIEVRAYHVYKDYRRAS